METIVYHVTIHCVHVATMKYKVIIKTLIHDILLFNYLYYFKSYSNDFIVDRSLDGTLLDAMYCIPCPNNTYPFLDGSKCLPCKTFEYNYYENDIYLTKYRYTQVQNYCLHKNISFDKENPKTAFQVKFKNKNIDSYYFRNELQTAIYFCKVRE